jgi:hypothetical protein
VLVSERLVNNIHVCCHAVLFCLGVALLTPLYQTCFDLYRYVIFGVAANCLFYGEGVDQRWAADIRCQGGPTPYCSLTTLEGGEI